MLIIKAWFGGKLPQASGANGRKRILAAVRKEASRNPAGTSVITRTWGPLPSVRIDSPRGWSIWLGAISGRRISSLEVAGARATIQKNYVD
jgi:hypothetical protein